MRCVRESFDADPAPDLFESKGVMATRRGNVIYAHCPHGLDSSTLSLRPFGKRPRKVTLLNDGRDIEASFDPVIYERHLPKALRLRGIPVDELSGVVPVFKIEL